MLIKAIVALSLPFALSGCSSEYDLRTVMLEGKVAFEPSERDIWGDPDCIRSIWVSPVDGLGAIPEEGDRIGLVENGVSAIELRTHLIRKFLPGCLR
jgi:hypothetical protein